MFPDHPVEVIGEGLWLVNDQVDYHKVLPPQFTISYVKDLLQISKVSISNTPQVLNLLRIPVRRGVHGKIIPTEERWSY